MTDYETKTLIELKALCKEKGITGYGSIARTKPKIIQLLKENLSKEKRQDFH